MSFLFRIFKIGYDEDGYNNKGYNKEGFNRDGFDRKGYDKSGYDEDGYNNKGYNKEGFGRDGFDRKGYERSGYDKNGYTIESKRFFKAQSNHDLEYNNSEIELAICYIEGIGVKKDVDKGFKILIDGAYKGSKDCLKRLGDLYCDGKIVSQNTNLARYIYDLSEGKNPLVMNQYSLISLDNFKNKKKSKNILLQEKSHLSKVIYNIKKEISSIRLAMENIDTETWWMDKDQLENWRIDKLNNINKGEQIYKLEKNLPRPYYARIDANSLENKEKYYIGENAYISKDEPETNIYSVWSEFGRIYRARNIHKFSINNYNYKIVLRRRFTIVDGEMKDYYDDYNEELEDSKAEITDPYLLRILEEKKNESNITNIIRSIQLNQNNIIEFDFDKSLIVQGCAGSGKTMERQPFFRQIYSEQKLTFQILLMPPILK